MLGMGRRISFAAAFTFVVGLARAEPPPNIVPPRASSPTSVEYPEKAAGDARVVLELVVDAEGGVSTVVIVEGDEPFASAATKAAWTWRFEPARRDGKPTASKIRFEVEFVEPEPQPVRKPEVAPTKPSPEATELDVRPPVRELEVTILGEVEAPAKTSMTRAEVREMPGAFGDPFRALEAMPGVVPMMSGIPFFYVRGAPPGNVGYFLDGIRVPYLFHLGLGPSVVNPALVEKVDLYSGGYPARYGRFAGGIVAAETTPAEYELHGEGNVRIFDAGILVEAPLARNRVAALAGGRYSYTAAVLSLFAPEVILQYWDYQARVTTSLSERDSATVFSFGAFDYLGEKEDGLENPLFGAEFHRIDLRWDHAPRRDTNLRMAMTLGVDRTRGGQGDLVVRDRMIAARSELQHRVDPQLLLRAGADVTVDSYDILIVTEQDSSDSAPDPEPQPPGVPGAPPPQQQLPPPDDEDEDESDREELKLLLPTRQDLASGFWVDVVWEPEPGVQITPGLRVDYYASDWAAAIGVDPRISAKFAVTKKVDLIHALGISHQPPSFIIPIPGFAIGGLRGGLQRSLQTSYGVETRLPWEFKGTVTVFNNVFLNMTDPLSNIDTGELENLDARSLGSASGLEVFLRRPITHRIGGFLSYTLSRSMRRVGLERFPSRFDRTHVFNLALGYDLGKNWRTGARLVYYTGFPVQDVEQEFSDEGEVFPRRPRSEHPPRAPSFTRIDFRLEKRWRFGEDGYWAFVVELLNATLSREVVSVECDFGTCREEKIGPVTIPSIGVEAKF